MTPKRSVFQSNAQLQKTTLTSLLLKISVGLLSVFAFSSANVSAQTSLSRPELEQKLTTLLETVPCAKLNSTFIDDASVSLTGFVGAHSYVKQLTDELQWLGVKVSTAIDIKPSPQCDVLSAFSDILTTATDLQVTVAGTNNVLLREGEPFTIEITTPSHPSYLYLTYIQANGDAIHLLQPTAKKLTPLAANTKLILGDGKNGNTQFKVQKPFGNEIIVAIASSTPLFSEPLPQIQTKQRYLKQFQSIFANQTSAKTAGQVISGTTASLITQAKP